MRLSPLPLTLALLLAAPAAARAVPILHAHRGGSISEGVADQYEDTLDAFRRRAAQTPGVWLKMDSIAGRRTVAVKTLA